MKVCLQARNEVKTNYRLNILVGLTQIL